MKIAITTKENDLSSQIDLRFGRANGFIVYDLTTDEYSFVDNVQNLEASQGAGIQSAQNVVNENVDAVVTGHCGPKAFKVLSLAGVKIYTTDGGTVEQAVLKVKNNELTEALQPDVEGHWV